MKIQFNWGTGIFAVIILFILMVIAFFIYINSLDIHLVEDNYYEKELVYQERIDKIKNTAAMDGKIEIDTQQGFLQIRFPQLEPEMKPEGNVLLYRPSDPEKDFSLPLQIDDSSSQAIDIGRIDPGKWIVKLEWEMGGKAYYFEENIFISH